jgi:hypothetical protein
MSLDMGFGLQGQVYASDDTISFSVGRDQSDWNLETLVWLLGGSTIPVFFE